MQALERSRLRLFMHPLWAAAAFLPPALLLRICGGDSPSSLPSPLTGTSETTQQWSKLSPHVCSCCTPMGLAAHNDEPESDLLLTDANSAHIWRSHPLPEGIVQCCWLR